MKVESKTLREYQEFKQIIRIEKYTAIALAIISVILAFVNFVYPLFIVNQ